VFCSETGETKLHICTLFSIDVTVRGDIFTITFLVFGFVFDYFSF